MRPPGAAQLSSASHHLLKVLITVLDINDFRPQFSKSQFSTSVYENEPAGTSVITMTATDLDEGDNGMVTYSIEGPGAGKWLLSGRRVTMRSNWRRHRGQARIPCPAAGLEQGFARAAFGVAPHFPVPHGVAFMALPAFVLGFSFCPLHPSRTFFVHK